MVFESRVKTDGLSDSWEMDLPHIQFSFEFDPLLSVDSILAMPDESRADVFRSSIRLSTPPPEQTARQSPSIPSILAKGWRSETRQ